jgi:hypothetical protein
MGIHGDNQIVGCWGPLLKHFDLRQNSSTKFTLKPVAEWKMPLTNITSVTSSLISDASLIQLTCSVSHEDFVCTGSSAGYVWIFDRRTGRPLHMWQAHESSIIKVSFL